MKYQYVPIIWWLFAATIITLFLGIYAIVRRRDAKGADTFAIAMLLGSIWTIFNALNISGATLETKIFWNNMVYIPCGFTPVVFLALCMQFTGYEAWLKTKKILLLIVPPAVFCLIKWTDVTYGLIHSNMHLAYYGPYLCMDNTYGPVFYIDIAYTFLISAASLILLVRALFFQNTIYRRQALALLVMMLIPHIFYITQLPFVNANAVPYDLTSLTFAPGGLIMTWALFGLKLFDLVPVARATVVETMETGVMVLDMQGRIIDINPAFLKILGLPPSTVTGQSIEVVCPIPDLLAACLDSNTVEEEILIESGEIMGNFEFLFSPLTDNHGKLIGRLVMCYDITEKRKAQQYHLQQQARLMVIEEQERIARDLHDNLGQLLAFISMQAQGVRQEFIDAGVEIASDNLDKLVGVTQTAHAEVRAYIKNARKLVLIEKDFISALDNEIETFQRLCDIEITTDIPRGFTGQDLSPHTKVNIINIVKEALNNVVKHARAQSVMVSIFTEPGVMGITVKDDGQGFDVNEKSDSSREKYGLRIMKERAEEIGAQIDIKSDKEIGTRVSLQVPV